MAKTKIDLKALSDQDLEQKIAEETLHLKRLKFSHAISPLENPMSIRQTRREIARLKTELRRRQLQPRQDAAIQSENNKQ
ncbi:large subunit ribosomal protein L29 [Thermoflavifilum aggregans]|uniref:Large ribosomal subunit protein uL29 n=1 Tax=Thermoflavifilum aggregans TaxID=454188 RepID=A0A2M9CTT3_9BACT|nr:50S ribosomal protein L29 [Thermoflavifilum aggregans]MBX6380458.1 50S ribosomal protein L29 [Thermoflavifilum aggregans]PJJ75265.1 large subunit ribosomal protein L29 [Thermoflavifilum aggregans]